jgi:hypothetical protein
VQSNSSSVASALNGFASAWLIAGDTSRCSMLQRMPRGSSFAAIGARYGHCTMIAQRLRRGETIMLRPFVIAVLLFVAMAAAPGCSTHPDQLSRGAHAVAVMQR